MSFISILLALLLEQVRPLSQVNPVYGSNRSWVHWVLRNFDAGAAQHGWLAWALAVLLPSVLTWVVYLALAHTLGWVAAEVWSVALLYVTLGFRQFSHHFTLIRDALFAGDETLARTHLAQWMRIDASELPRREIIRHVIEYSVRSAHRHVFGVFAWYSLLAALGLGPAGAVFYRTCEYLARSSARAPSVTRMSASASLRAVAQHAWYLTDWIPARLTALGFAFVGSFEEAVESWRRHDAEHPHDNDGLLLAATAGAVNVRLGEGASETEGSVPEVAHLRAVVGLVWRTVVMWMVFLALLSLARLIG